MSEAAEHNEFCALPKVAEAHNLVDLIRCDAGTDRGVCLVEDLAGHAADSSQPLDVLG